MEPLLIISGYAPAICHLFVYHTCHMQVTCNKTLVPHQFVQVLPIAYCRLDVSAAQSYGLVPGPLLGQLKAGMAVTAPDGTVVSTGSSFVHMATSLHSHHAIPRQHVCLHDCQLLTTNAHKYTHAQYNCLCISLYVDIYNFFT